MYSDSWSSLVTYSAISHYHFLIYSAGRYLFCELCLPWYPVHHLLLLDQKCNNVRDLYKLTDFCPLNSPDLSTFISKYGAASLVEKCRMWMIWGRIWLMREMEWNRALLTTALISGADVSMPALEPQEDIFNIHHDIN